MSNDGIFQSVLKIKPPLVFSEANADELLQALTVACKDVAINLDVILTADTEIMSRIYPGQEEAQKYFRTLEIAPG
jgi:hypothetical protein